MEHMQCNCMYNDGKLALVSVVSSNLAPSKPVIRERRKPISAERRHHSYGGAVVLGAYGSCRGPSFPLSEVRSGLVISWATCDGPTELILLGVLIPHYAVIFERERYSIPCLDIRFWMTSFI